MKTEKIFASEFDGSKENEWKPQDLPLGLVCPSAGNSREYNTGAWRSMRPIWNKEVCNNCMMCWVYCPDSSIIVKDGEMTGIDLGHCKGCGVCVSECSFNCLELITESEAKEREGK